MRIAIAIGKNDYRSSYIYILGATYCLHQYKGSFTRKKQKSREATATGYCRIFTKKRIFEIKIAASGKVRMNNLCEMKISETLLLSPNLFIFYLDFLWSKLLLFRKNEKFPVFPIFCGFVEDILAFWNTSKNTLITLHGIYILYYFYIYLLGKYPITRKYFSVHTLFRNIFFRNSPISG